MIANTIESTLHKCQRRQAHLAAATDRPRQPVGLETMPAPSGTRIAALPGPTRILTDQVFEDLGQASWEDAEWR